MSNYDHSILQKHVDDLYRQAESVVSNHRFNGGAIGLGIGLLLYFFVDKIWMTLICIAIGAGIGWLSGKEEAFNIKLTAQKLLCQMQIEENTALIAKALSKDSDVEAGPVRQ